MEAWQIILLIIMIVLFVYAIGLMIVISHGLEFRHRLTIRLSALATVMSEKRRLLLLIGDALHDMDIPQDETGRETIDKIEKLELSKIRFHEAKAALSTLNAAQHRLSYVVQMHPEIAKNADYQEMSETLAENDRSIRQETSAYNMDVVALNYWMSIPLISWVNYLFGLRKQEPIV